MAPTAQAAPRVLMIVNEGFWAPEHFVPRTELEQAGYEIVVAGKRAGEIRPDERNKEFPAAIAKLAFSEVRVADYEAIVFAGGNGAWTDYFPNDEAHRILAESLNSGKLTALLCSSTGLLAVAQNFDGRTPIAVGRKVTGYYRVRGLLEKVGQVSYDPGIEGTPYVVVDKNLITGRDPISSKLFGETVVSALKKGK